MSVCGLVVVYIYYIIDVKMKMLILDHVEMNSIHKHIYMDMKMFILDDSILDYMGNPHL